MTGVLIRGRRGRVDTHRNTEERSPFADRRRDWSNVSRIQETPSIAGSHRKLGKKHGIDFPSDPPEGRSTLLTAGLQKCERINISCFKLLPNLW